MNKLILFIPLSVFLALPASGENRPCVNHGARSAAIIKYIEDFITEHPDLTEKQVDILRVFQALHQRIVDGEEDLPWKEQLDRILTDQFEDAFWWWERMEFSEGMRPFSCKNFKKPCDAEIKAATATATSQN